MTTQKAVLVAVAAALLLLCHGAAASKFCKIATNKSLCDRMVGKASNLHDASANAIKATLTMAKKIQAMSGAAIAPAVTKAKLKGITKHSIIDTCHESFEDAVDELNLSLDALAADDHDTVMTHLSAALPSDCGDALQEFGVSFPLQNTVEYYTQFLESTLAVVAQQ